MNLAQRFPRAVLHRKEYARMASSFEIIRMLALLFLLDEIVLEQAQSLAREDGQSAKGRRKDGKILKCHLARHGEI